jgi:hypothetical protein
VVNHIVAMLRVFHGGMPHFDQASIRAMVDRDVKRTVNIASSQTNHFLIALTVIPEIFGTVDADAVLARRTRYGDANLDGLVNLGDFNRLAANFGSTDAVWTEGDFTYDGLVNLADFNRLAANFGLVASANGPTPEDWAALASVVPEPSSLTLLGVAAASLSRRRRKV